LAFRVKLGVYTAGPQIQVWTWVAAALGVIWGSGVIHWQYDVFGMLSVMLLGVGNALLVWRTGSLFPAVMVHALYNFLIAVMVLVSYQMPP
jgi:membrane protease YdiL (CAAX protease family)